MSNVVEVVTCSVREGKKQCPWWVSGCLNPAVDPETKRECARSCGNLPRTEVRK